MTDGLYVSRDCDGLTKVWRHKPMPAEGPTVQITPRGMFVKAKGTTQLDAIRNAVEAAEQGVGE